MKAQFSELQFAYGITREIEEGAIWHNVGIPYFPNLYDEGDLGYDVKFEGIAPIYFQYKVPHWLMRSNAREWHHFGRPYFRFDIYAANISNQHNLLKRLSELHDAVYYCSPAFFTNHEYLRLHQQGLISQNSIFVPLRDLPRNNGNDEHSIVYNINPIEYYFCSEVKKIHGIYGWNQVKEDIYRNGKVFNSLESYIMDVIPFINDLEGTNLDLKSFVDSKYGYKVLHYISDVLLKYMNISLTILKLE